MCAKGVGPDHLWNSDIGVKGRVIVCDWCVSCGDPRPGFIDPRERRFDDGKYTAAGDASSGEAD